MTMDSLSKDEGFVLLMGLTLGAVMAITGISGLIITVVVVFSAKKWIL